MVCSAHAIVCQPVDFDSAMLFPQGLQHFAGARCILTIHSGFVQPRVWIRVHKFLSVRENDNVSRSLIYPACGLVPVLQLPTRLMQNSRGDCCLQTAASSALCGPGMSGLQQHLLLSSCGPQKHQRRRSEEARSSPSISRQFLWNLLCSHVLARALRA